MAYTVCLTADKLTARAGRESLQMNSWHTKDTGAGMKEHYMVQLPETPAKWPRLGITMPGLILLERRGTSRGDTKYKNPKNDRDLNGQ